jgi:hypothetical protein
MLKLILKERGERKQIIGEIHKVSTQPEPTQAELEVTRVCSETSTGGWQAYSKPNGLRLVSSCKWLSLQVYL